MEVLDDPFLQSVASTAGCSNILSLPKEEKRMVREALQKIQQLISKAEGVNEDHAPLISLADKLRVAIAPHKTLPAEILGAIFKALMPLSEIKNTLGALVATTEETEGSDLHGFSSKWLDIMSWDYYEPRRIRGVCSSWRRAALDQRDLWSNIQLAWPLPSHLTLEAARLPMETLVDMATRIIPPTGPINVRFFIFLRVNNRSLEPNVPYAFSKLALGLADRLSSLNFTADAPELDLPFYLPESVTFPILRAVKIGAIHGRITGTRLPGSHGPIRSILHCSPNLQEIDVRLGPFEDTIFSQPVPWPRITHLTLYQPLPLTTLFPALKNGEELRSLTAVLRSPMGSNSIQGEAILPRLEELSLYLSPGSDVLFNVLRVPSLSKVCLTGRSSSASCMEKLVAMINRSGSPLTSFEDDTPYDASSSVAFLRLATTMSKLRVFKTEAVVEESFV